MLNAKDLLKLVSEADGSFNIGDVVQFVKGHEFEGMTGQIANIQPSGNVDVMVGKSIRVDIPVDQLELVPSATGESLGENYHDDYKRNIDAVAAEIEKAREDKQKINDKIKELEKKKNAIINKYDADRAAAQKSGK